MQDAVDELGIKKEYYGSQIKLVHLLSMTSFCTFGILTLQILAAVAVCSLRTRYLTSWHCPNFRYYTEYVDNAVAQTSKGKGNKKSGMFSKKQQTDDSGRFVGSFKYSAQKLKEKGVRPQTAVFPVARLCGVIPSRSTCAGGLPA